MQVLREYLGRLFHGWLALVSNSITLLSLIAALFGDSILTGIPLRLSKEWFFLLAFLSFAYSNYRIFAAHASPRLRFEIAEVHDLNLLSSPVTEAGNQVAIADTVKVGCAARIRLANSGPPTSVRLSFLDPQPDCLVGESQGTLLGSTLKKRGSGTALENPYYLRTDDMLDDLQLTAELQLDIACIEKAYGSLSKTQTLTLACSAETPSGARIVRHVAFDLKPLSERVSELFQAKMQHCQDGRLSTASIMAAIERYYGGTSAL